MIPKIIHYVWINEDPRMPEKQKECIKSWRNLMPEYKLEFWDYNRCKDLRIKFIDDAIKAKKYAFATDVVRAVALYNYGGLYLDTDILLYKDLTPILNSSFVSFIELHPHLVKNNNITFNKRLGIHRFEGFGLLVACMASEKHHPFLLDIIKYYNSFRFKGRLKNFFMTYIADDIYASKLLPYGFQYKDKLQKLSSEITIYPSNYFRYCKADKESSNTSNLYGSHLCYGTWQNKITPLNYCLNWIKIKIFKQDI